MPVVRTVIIFAIAFSLVSLPSVLSSNFYLPSIPVVRALQEASGVWYPAGAQEQTLSISQGDGASGTQVGWLLTNQVDAEDWPLTASQQGSGSGNVNCRGTLQSCAVFQCQTTDTLSSSSTSQTFSGAFP